MDQLPHQLSGQRVGRRLGVGASSRADIVSHAGPELVLGNRELVPKDDFPEVGPVSLGIQRPRYAGPKDGAVRENELPRDVVANFTASSVSHLLPMVVDAELVVVGPAAGVHAGRSGSA